MRHSILCLALGLMTACVSLPKSAPKDQHYAYGSQLRLYGVALVVSGVVGGIGLAAGAGAVASSGVDVNPAPFVSLGLASVLTLIFGAVLISRGGDEYAIAEAMEQPQPLKTRPKDYAPRELDDRPEGDGNARTATVTKPARPVFRPQ